MLFKHLLNFNIFYKLKTLLNNYTFPAQKIESLQLKKLKKLLNHSYYQFEFYKSLFNRAGVNLNSIKSVGDIQKLPVIDKEMYREYSYSLVKKNPDLYKKYFQDGTSGSTGKP